MPDEKFLENAVKILFVQLDTEENKYKLTQTIEKMHKDIKMMQDNLEQL